MGQSSVRVESLEERLAFAITPVANVVQMNDTTMSFAGVVSLDAWSGGVVGFFTNRLRRFNLNGQPVGASIPAPSSLDQYNVVTKIGVDSTGNTVLAWQAAVGTGGLYHIMFQRYSSALSPQGSPIEVVSSASLRNALSLCVNPDGKFAIAWQTFDANSGLFINRYDHVGQQIGSTITVQSPLPSGSSGFKICDNSAGTTAVVWRVNDAPNASTSRIKMQFIDASGGLSPAQPIEVAAVGTTGLDANIAPDNTIAIAWGQTGTYPSPDTVFVRLFTMDGTPKTAAFPVLAATGTGLASDSTNTFTAVMSAPDNSNSDGVFARRFDTSGNLLSGVFRVNDPVEGNQRCTSLVSVGERTYFGWSAFSNPVASEGQNAFLRAIQGVPDTSAGHLVSAAYLVDSSFQDTRLSLTFSAAVWANIPQGDLAFTNTTTGTTIDAMGRAVHTSLQTTHTIALTRYNSYFNGNWHLHLSRHYFSDRWGNPLATDVDADFFVLPGDANRDRRVDTEDFNILAGNFGKLGKFTQGDFDYSGGVNSEDFNILVASFGYRLPQPIPSPALFAKDELSKPDLSETL
jgi:hypothetical protein